MFAGRVALSLATTESRPQRHVPDRQFIAKIEMAMRCKGVGGREVGVKCGCMQGCCEGARPGMRSWRAMLHVDEDKFCAAAR